MRRCCRVSLHYISCTPTALPGKVIRWEPVAHARPSSTHHPDIVGDQSAIHRCIVNTRTDSLSTAITVNARTRSMCEPIRWFARSRAAWAEADQIGRTADGSLGPIPARSARPWPTIGQSGSHYPDSAVRWGRRWCLVAARHVPGTRAGRPHRGGVSTIRRHHRYHPQLAVYGEHAGY